VSSSFDGRGSSWTAQCSLEPRIGDWIQTCSGVAFYPFDPRPEEILIEDIAHALSMICRFTGHVARFYSVAEHSVHVSRLVPPQHALAALLHDAAEAYLGDIARPIKRMPELAELRAAESRLQKAIYQKFGLPCCEPECVKEADVMMLGAEARELMSPLTQPRNWDWCVEAGRQVEMSEPLSPEAARLAFLQRFAELTR
jgi:hypothetical protein